MWGILCKYGKEVSAASSVHIKLYSYLYQLYHRYDTDTDNEPNAPEPAAVPSEIPDDIMQPVSFLDNLDDFEKQS